MKQAADIMVSLVGLTLLFPLLFLIWLCLVLAYGSPGFFYQQRIGRYGHEFILTKFRTMRLLPGSEKGSFEPGNRERVSTFGQLLRAYKIDELPQLWNVIKGEMSFVGPRPEIRRWVDAYPERWRKVLSIKPGITDPASLFYRNEEAILAASQDPEMVYREIILPHKLDIYERYIDNSTFLGDLGVVAETLGKIILKSTNS